MPTTALLQLPDFVVLPTFFRKIFCFVPQFDVSDMLSMKHCMVVVEIVAKAFYLVFFFK